MENNTNELLGIGDNILPNSDFVIFDYSSYRDAFWKKRYPASRVLYYLSMILGWIVVVLSVLLLLAVAANDGILKDFGIIFLVLGVLAGIMLLIISETILFQIDKNFFAYMEIHKRLELLKGDK